jgi:hypothetical protein
MISLEMDKEYRVRVSEDRVYNEGIRDTGILPKNK